MRLQYLAVAFLVFAGGVAGQPTNTTGSPGLIGPDNPLYGLEVSIEDGLIGTPIGQSPGSLAQERASEAKIAFENGLNQSFERANRSLNRVAEKASEADADGLQKASQILQTIQSEASDNAAPGLDTALDQLSEVMNRSTPTGRGNSGPPAESDQQPRP